MERLGKDQQEPWIGFCSRRYERAQIPGQCSRIARNIHQIRSRNLSQQRSNLRVKAHARRVNDDEIWASMRSLTVAAKKIQRLCAHCSSQLCPRDSPQAHLSKRMQTRLQRRGRSSQSASARTGPRLQRDPMRASLCSRQSRAQQAHQSESDSLERTRRCPRDNRTRQRDS